MQITRKRSDRTSPSKQAGVQLFFVVPKRDGGLCQASVRDDFAGTDCGVDSPWGLVASVDLKDA